MKIVLTTIFLMKNYIYNYIFTILIALIFFASCGKIKQNDISLFNAVPESSSLIINTENADSVSKLINSNQVFVSLFYNSKSEVKMPLVFLVDSLKQAGVFGDFLSDNAIFAVRKDGNCGLAQLYVRTANIDGDSDIRQLKEILQNFGSIETKIASETEIIKFKANDLSYQLSFCFAKGIAIISTSAKYLEDATMCLQGKSKRLIDNELFNSAYSASGKNELANVCVDVRSFLGIFGSELFEDNSLVKTISASDGWLVLDLVETKPLVMNGFEFAKVDTSTLQALVKSQPSIEFIALSIVPEKSAAYLLMSFASSAVYDSTLDAYLAQQGRKKVRDALTKEMDKAFGFSAKTRFYSLINKEFAYIVAKSTDEAQSGVYVACGLLSQSAAEAELRKMLPEGQQVITDELAGVRIFKMPYNDIPAVLFGELFANCRGSYVCCVKNFLVFANSIDDLRLLVREVNRNNTMQASLVHSEFLTNFSSSSSVFAYFSFKQGQGILQRVFSQQYANDLVAKHNEIAEIGLFGMQLKRLDDKLYCNIAVCESDHNQELSLESLWETNVGTALATKPFIVKNHDTKENEIIVQDVKNVLYLFNSQGREIWHIQLDEQIQSAIYQVDAYKNGKLQYLFSSSNKIYLIDRLGNNLSRYPISLRDSAVSPVSVFDYDKNNNYRLAIACANNEVYVYDIDGNLLKGWEFEETESVVNSQISHFAISGEDFIAFHDDYKAYFLARNGNAKMAFPTTTKFSNNNFYCDLTNTPKFVTTTEKGTICRFFKNKTQDSIVLGNFSDKHLFAMKDINSDGRLDYIFADSSKLTVFGADKRLLFDYNFEVEIKGMAFYYFGGQQCIGVLVGDNKIYLLNANGTLYDGFPLDGDTPFSICELDREADYYNLLVGSKRRSLCNYKVQK